MSTNHSLVAAKLKSMHERIIGSRIDIENSDVEMWCKFIYALQVVGILSSLFHGYPH